jgi:hypothetical protein
VALDKQKKFPDFDKFASAKRGPKLQSPEERLRVVEQWASLFKH